MIEIVVYQTMRNILLKYFFPNLNISLDKKSKGSQTQEEGKSIKTI